MSSHNKARVEYEGQQALELLALESWDWFREALVAKANAIRVEVMAGELTHEQYLAKTAKWQTLKAMAALPDRRAKDYMKLREESKA